MLGTKKLGSALDNRLQQVGQVKAVHKRQGCLLDRREILVLPMQDLAGLSMLLLLRLQRCNLATKLFQLSFQCIFGLSLVLHQHAPSSSHSPHALEAGALGPGYALSAAI